MTLPEDSFHWLTHTWQSEGIGPHKSPGANTLNEHLIVGASDTQPPEGGLLHHSADSMCKTGLWA